MNAPTEAPCSTLDRSTLHGKRPEAAKRKALGMGISPRALGRAATARADRGTCRAQTGNFLERRQQVTSSGGGSFWRQGRRRARGGGRCRGSPSCWTPRINSLKSGGGPEQFWQPQRLGVGAVGSGRFLESRLS